jgi:hypothetical protein
MVSLFMRPSKLRGKVEPPRCRSAGGGDKKEREDKGELLFHVPAPCLRAATLRFEKTSHLAMTVAATFRAEKGAATGATPAADSVPASILWGLPLGTWISVILFRLPILRPAAPARQHRNLLTQASQRSGGLGVEPGGGDAHEDRNSPEFVDHCRVAPMVQLRLSIQSNPKKLKSV